MLLPNLNLSIRMVLSMKDNLFGYVRDFFDEAPVVYIDDIRGDNPHAFTRTRKLPPYRLMLQMFAQKGKTQLSELMNLYKDLDTNLDVSTVAFFNARMKFNPYALKLMSRDFLSEIYDRENESFVKLNGYYVTAVDGSDFVLPSTDDNAMKYGRATNNSVNLEEDDYPVEGKLSVIYDCINKCIFDSEIGEYKHSERDFASKHLKSLKEIIRVPTITIFDRGYFSMRLVDQMIEDHQKFLFRLPKGVLNRYVDQVSCGEDKIFDVTFNRVQTNDYREDRKFRMKLMNTVYQLRIVKIPIVNADTGKIDEEILVTNLSQDEFDIEALKELYHLRWEIETAYNILKNKMKIEEFSGYRERLILQDIYACIWLYNIIMMRIIEINEENEIPEERYKYEMKRNINITIGIVKTYFVKSIILAGKEESVEYFNTYTGLINKYLVPIRPGRHYKRGKKKNKSRMSYRYTY